MKISYPPVTSDQFVAGSARFNHIQYSLQFPVRHHVAYFYSIVIVFFVDINTSRKSYIICYISYMSHRETTKAALDRYFKRQLEEEKPKERRKNKAPEKDVVKKLCAWMRVMGWDYDIVEASTYDRIYKERVEAKITAGFSDIVACAPGGTACYIEAKAPGRRATLKCHQRDFLERKIVLGAFAVCVDSPELLNQLWSEYTSLKLKRLSTEAFLLRQLPQKKKPDDAPLFDDL